MKPNPNITVLYLDDEPINLKVIELTLGRYFNIIICKNASDALDQVKNNKTLTHVISDLLMPDMNGLEFIKKAQNLNNHIKYYIHSGINMSNEIEEAIANKTIDGFFEKPLDLNSIYNSINA